MIPTVRPSPSCSCSSSYHCPTGIILQPTAFLEILSFHKISVVGVSLYLNLLYILVTMDFLLFSIYTSKLHHINFFLDSFITCFLEFLIHTCNMKG